jgi:hypothetical protein
MIRRITIAADHPLVEICRAHGYNIEYKLGIDGQYDRGSVVVEFPYSYPEWTRLASEMTAIDQLEEVRKIQSDWSDNSVSCTIYYRKEELPEIREYLERYYKNNFKSLSFLLHSESGFVQQPYEEITEEKYNELVANTTIITALTHAEYEANDECSSGACPIR